MNNDRRQRLSKGLVSIVVPAYNAEQFLRENIESIINQTYEQLEIIYVCDGCIDHTVEILHEYADKDPRIIVKVETENHGAAISRNIGMEIATGDWIIFFDADDVFDKYMIEEMLETAVNEQADIAACYWESFDEVPNENAPINNERLRWCCKSYPLIETEKELYQIMQIVNTGPCTKLVHKSIFAKKEVYFQNIPNANDIYYSMVTAVNSNRIAYIDKAFLHYRSNKGRHTLSTDRNYRKSYVFEAYNKVFEYIKNQENTMCLLRSFYNSVFFCLYLYLDCGVYDSLFDSLISIYMDIWEMNKQDISSQLNCINRILYRNILNNNRETDRQKIIMRAKIEFIQTLSTNKCSVWGAGLLGNNLLKEISNTDIKIQHVYDSAQDKWGKTVQGHVVEGIDKIQTETIIVTTPKYFDDIRKQIGDKVKNVYNLEQQIWQVPYK